jgi:hypothetical protein
VCLLLLLRRTEPGLLVLRRTEPGLLVLLAEHWTITDPQTKLRRHALTSLLLLPSTTTAAALLVVAVRTAAATAVGRATAALSLC